MNSLLDRLTSAPGPEPFSPRDLRGAAHNPEPKGPVPAALAAPETLVGLLNGHPPRNEPVATALRAENARKPQSPAGDLPPNRVAAARLAEAVTAVQGEGRRP